MAEPSNAAAWAETVSHMKFDEVVVGLQQYGEEECKDLVRVWISGQQYQQAVAEFGDATPELLFVREHIEGMTTGGGRTDRRLTCQCSRS